MTTHPRRRLFRLAKWTSAFLSALIFAGWLITIPGSDNQVMGGEYYARRYGISLVRGYISIHIFSAPVADQVTEWFKHWFRAPETTHGVWTYGFMLPSISRVPATGDWFRRMPPSVCVIVPLWLPFLLTAGATVFLWHRDRRQPGPGHCKKCNYNLTGNTSGICPECGTTVVMVSK